MHSRDFLYWMENNSQETQRSAARMLARAYSQGRLNEKDKRDAEQALLVLLEKSDIVLRVAIAHELAEKEFVSPVLLTSLIDDEDKVADPVIVASPLLRDSDLISLFERRSERIRTAIAMRPVLSIKLCRLISDIGEISSCRALVRNKAIFLEKDILQHISSRFPKDRSLGAGLLQRKNLPAILRQEKTLQLEADEEIGALKDKEVNQAWLEQDMREKVTLKLCMETNPEDLRDFVRQLRLSKQLTPSFILRSTCWGQILLIIYITSELSDFSELKVEKIMSRGSGTARRRLWRQIGLSYATAFALETALSLFQKLPEGETVYNPLEFCAELTWEVIETCDKSDIKNMDRVVTLLKRIHLHIVRDLARQQIVPKLHHIA